MRDCVLNFKLHQECSTFTQMIWKDSRAVGACITWFGDVSTIRVQGAFLKLYF